MSKEKIELITITAYNPRSHELKKTIQDEREANSESLILVRTSLARNTEMAGKQVRALFRAGANALQNLSPEDKKIISTNFLECLRAFFGKN